MSKYAKSKENTDVSANYDGVYAPKIRFPLYVYPETMKTVESIYRSDNCSTKTEFMEKAIRFYCAHLTSGMERSFISMWKSCEPFSNPSVKRMLTVAHGTFCLVDAGDAVITQQVQARSISVNSFLDLILPELVGLQYLFTAKQNEGLLY